MKVSSVIYAEEVLQENAGTTVRNHIINPLSVILVPFTPATFTFVITINLIDLTDNPKEIHVKFKKKGDEKSVVEMGPINVPVGISIPHIPTEFAGLNFNLNLRNVVLPSEGEYETEIYFDNVLTGSYPINVVKSIS